MEPRSSMKKVNGISCCQATRKIRSGRIFRDLDTRQKEWSNTKGKEERRTGEQRDGG